MINSLSLSIPSSLSLVILYLGMIIIIAERLNRHLPGEKELTRKVVHIGAGNVILLAWWLNIPVSVIILAAVIAGIIALTSYFIPILPSINSVGRQSLGTFFYAVSIGVLVAYFWTLGQPQYAAIGILIMAWGDGLAALVGQRFGKHPYSVLGNQKSWEGSVTMVGVSFLITTLVLLAVEGNIWQIWIIALIVAIAASGLESFSKLGIDNLTVPIGSATLTFFLSQWLL